MATLVARCGALRGVQDGSVFRLLLGRALIRRDGAADCMKCCATTCGKTASRTFGAFSSGYGASFRASSQTRIGG